MRMIMIILPMEERSGGYDIVQTPNGILVSDLPGKMELDKPFEIDGQVYVCEKYGEEVMAVSEVENGRSKMPTKCRSFYVVRRL
ncbi:hypothetical protein HK407_01g01860 [Ordospora pajunii]|uniref:uncharacterized protein n=1 Tax=Ordospora pajunii TaxID=3039483 RepID=UPI0029526B5E|nr:uncharacterized protein HK407_01g01860 [Ordospora pajunii]KAH9412292.1 hypothetical protein HK407_01g01860 [Ordospora pajunii]